MNSEQLKKTEQDVNNPPTSLDLFVIDGERRNSLTQRVNPMARFNREFFSSAKSLVTLNGEYINKMERLADGMVDMSEQQMKLRSSRTSSFAYLRIYDELSERNVSSKDILDFFKLCLKINTFNFSQSRQLYSAEGPTGLAQERIKKGKKENKTRSFLENNIPEPPEWFGNDKARWKAFIVDHANFPLYLNPNDVESFTKKRHKGKDYSDRLGITVEDGLPDWLLDLNGNIPDGTVVLEDYEVDTQEDNNLRKHMNDNSKQVDYLVNLVSEKYRNAALRFEQRRRNIFNSYDTLPDLFTALRSIRNIWGYSAELEEISTFTLSQFATHEIPSVRLQEKMIEEFSQNEPTTFDKYIVALWIEKNLKDGKIITSAKEKIPTNFLDLLDVVIEEKQNNPVPSEKIQDIRSENKNAFNVLKYEISPLLSGDELSYIRELTKALQDKSIEEVIWEIAELVSLKYKKGVSTETPKQTQITMNHLKSFSRKWIKANWEWAYDQLYDSLTKPIERPTEEKNDEIEILEQTQTDNSIEQEIQVAIEEIKRDNLMKWNIEYLPDPDREKEIEEAELVHIGGDALSEREEAFTKFVRTNSISCRKPASVIQALERIAGEQGTTEEFIRMRKVIRGEEFKKLRIDDVRVFYKVDPNTRRIIFATHQKKDWDYGY